MANWKKKEAGFMVIRPNAESENFVLEKFHNSMERESIEEKYNIFNPVYEYQVGTFQNNEEIIAAMADYKGNEPRSYQEPLPALYEYRYAIVKIGRAYGLEDWSDICSEKQINDMECPKGYILRTQVRVSGGKWREHNDHYCLEDFKRIFCGGK